jgi:phosphonate transport system substrate-binding protein
MRLWRHGIGRSACHKLAAALLLFCCGLPAVQAGPLVFGVLPSESPLALFKRLAPLREYLGRRLGKEVVLESAKDFAQHVRRTDQGRYDIVLTAPHMALRALDRDRYEVVASFVKPLSAVLVVPENSPVRTSQDLARLRIATPPERAIVTMVGKEHLADLGLVDLNLPHYRSFRTHNAAYEAALAGQVDAAIMSNFYFAKARRNGKPLRRVLASRPFPGIGVLVARDLPKMMRVTIRQAFVELQATEQGRALLAHIGQPPYGRVGARQFESLRPFLPVLDLDA